MRCQYPTNFEECFSEKVISDENYEANWTREAFLYLWNWVRSGHALHVIRISTAVRYLQDKWLSVLKSSSLTTLAAQGKKSKGNHIRIFVSNQTRLLLREQHPKLKFENSVRSKISTSSWAPCSSLVDNWIGFLLFLVCTTCSIW